MPGQASMSDTDAVLFPPLTSTRERSPRKAWLHLATSSSASSSSCIPSPVPTAGGGGGAGGTSGASGSCGSIRAIRKRPKPLRTVDIALDSCHSDASSGAAVSTTAVAGPASTAGSEDTEDGGMSMPDTRFPFISPVEPVLTLARFHRSLNKVYIPLDDEEELEVGEQGFRSLNGVGSNFALLGTPGSSLLGGGAFGLVYKAIHFPTMRRVAIKKIPKDFGRTNDYANSFARELRNLYTNVQRIAQDTTTATTTATGSATTLSTGVGSARQPLAPPPSALPRTARDAMGANTGAHCPYLLTLYDAYIERNPTNLCLVLEYMEGGSLEQLMARAPGGCDDEGFLREVCHNVLKGLHHLHQRAFLHQDVKPSNILLTASRFAKLADFGLTVAVNSEEDTMGANYTDTVAVGTARYWPPELWGTEKRRDPHGKGDVWGLGLSVLALVNGKEPLEGCTTRSQVEIELFEAARDAATSGRPCAAVAEERGVFSTERLLSDRAFSPAFRDFVLKCLQDLPARPTAAELLQHPFIKEYCRAVGSRQRELDEAVKALKTHIQIHKEWKVTPQMVELLAKELRIKSSDLREYLDLHLDPALMLTDRSFKDAHSSPASAAADDEEVEEEEDGDDVHGSGNEDPTTARSTNTASTTMRGLLDLSNAAAFAPATAEEEEEGGEEGEEEEDDFALGEEHALQMALLRHYDELDRLRTEVIPPMEDLIQTLTQQVREKDAILAKARQEIADLRRQLQLQLQQQHARRDGEAP